MTETKIPIEVEAEIKINVVINRRINEPLTSTPNKI